MFTIPDLQAARDPRQFKHLACPHCGTSLSRNAALVVATRNCPGCGRRVVADPDADHDRPPFTAEQLDAAHAAHSLARSRASWVLLSIFLFWLGEAVAFGLYRDTIRAAVRPVIDPGWLGMSLLMLAAVTGVAIALRIMSRGERAAPKCPSCAAPVYHITPLVRLTGNCWKCGRWLVEPTPAEEPAAALPPVAELQAAHARSNRPDWTGWLIFAVLIAAPFGVFALGNPEEVSNAVESRHGAVAAAAVASVLISAWVLGLFGIMCVGVRWLTRRHERRRAADPVLNCPHCRAGLLPPEWAVASRRCPACRRPVLADPGGVAAPAASG